MSDSVTPLTTPNSNNVEFELLPAGQYLARCYKMVDIGTQTQVSPKYGTTVARKILLYWEILKDTEGTDVRMEDGRPFSISKEYTWSLHKKANLRKDLESWEGEPFTEEQAKDFEISKLLDRYCLLQVVHKPSADGERTYVNVGVIMSAKQHDLAVNELSSFSITAPNMEMFDSFPEWLQDKISSAKEWAIPEGKLDEKKGEITDKGEIKIEDVGDEELKKDLENLPWD